MAQLLSSKVAVEEETGGVRQATTPPTAVAGFVLVTERGPVGTPTLVTSVEEFTNIFGSHVANSDGAAMIRGYFDNGGSIAYVTRTVHYSDVTNAATKASAQATVNVPTGSVAAQSGYVDGTVVAPFNFEPNDTLKVKVDGAGALTATFTATAAARESAAEPHTLANAQTLVVAIDGGSAQTITFSTAEFVDITNATSEEVAAVINSQLVGGRATVTTSGTKVTITSDRKGSGSGVNVSGGTANTELAFTTGNIAGTGNVSNIDAVTVAELKTVVEAAVAGVTVSDQASKVRITRNTTGSGASVQVDTTSTTEVILGLDTAVHAGVNAGTLNTFQAKGRTDGAYANSIKPKVMAATSGEAERFDLQVLDASNVILESFANLSMVDTDPRYVETIVNAEIAAGGSRYISVTDLDAATPSPNDRPANGTYTLTGGGDGLTSLADADFSGDQTGRTGIRALDAVEDLTLLAVGSATAAVHAAMVTYCEVTRGGQVFPILDPPAGLTVAGAITYFETTAGLRELSEFGMMAWPRIKVANPKKSVFGNGDMITIPPSGHIMGAMARTDGARDGGIYDLAANVDRGRLLGVLDVENREVNEESKRDLLFPKRINPIRRNGSSGPYYLDGGRTLKSTGNWGYINQRRGVSFITRSLRSLVDIYRHKNNTPSLRAEIGRTANVFMLGQVRAGAFATDDPSLAYFLDIGDSLNPSSRPNTITMRIGVAMATPGEFIVIKIGPDTRAIEAELAAAGV